MVPGVVVDQHSGVYDEQLSRLVCTPTEATPLLAATSRERSTHSAEGASRKIVYEDTQHTWKT